MWVSNDAVDHTQDGVSVVRIRHGPSQPAACYALALRAQLAGNNRNSRHREFAERVAERLLPDGQHQSEMNPISSKLADDISRVIGTVVHEARSIDHCRRESIAKLGIR